MNDKEKDKLISELSQKNRDLRRCLNSLVQIIDYSKITCKSLDEMVTLSKEVLKT